MRFEQGKPYLLSKGGRVCAVEVFEAVLKDSLPHHTLHHIHTLQVEVIHRVEGRDAARIGLGQSQELLSCSGNGLTRWIQSDRKRGKVDFNDVRK